MRRNTRSTALAFVLLLLAGAATAQEWQGPQRWMVTSYTVKPGMQGQHEALARRYRAAAEAVGWTRPWFHAVTLASAEPRYLVAIPVDTMTMFDDPMNLIIEAEGQDGLAEVATIARETYSSVATAMAVARPDLGLAAPEMDAPPVGYISIRVHVRPGSQGVYTDYLRSLVQASSTPQYWNLFQGGPGAPNTFTANIPIREWAQMDQPPQPGILARLQAEFGDRRGAAIFESSRNAIEEMHVDLMRWRWDLSWIPDAET